MAEMILDYLGGPKITTGILKRWTQGGMTVEGRPHVHGDSGWSEVAARQRTPVASRSWKVKNRLPAGASRKTDLANTLILAQKTHLTLLTSKAVGEYACAVVSHRVRDTVLQRPHDTNAGKASVTSPDSLSPDTAPEAPSGLLG